MPAWWAEFCPFYYACFPINIEFCKNITQSDQKASVVSLADVDAQGKNTRNSWYKMILPWLIYPIPPSSRLWISLDRDGTQAMVSRALNIKPDNNNNSNDNDDDATI